MDPTDLCGHPSVDSLQVKYVSFSTCKNMSLRLQHGSATNMRAEPRAALPDQLQTQASITKMVFGPHCEDSSFY